jgi:hypothetical protein
VKALQLGGLPPLHIEYLGWLSGTAGAINNSSNPVRAAHTCLANDEKRKEPMLDKFIARKLDAACPRRVTREDHSKVDQKLKKLQAKLDQFAEDNVPQGDAKNDEEDL